MTRAFGPTDPDGGAPAISFEYVIRNGGAPNGLSYAITRHKDVQHPNDTIDTVVLVDGFTRVVQTKKDSEVVDALGNPQPSPVISGVVEYDILGRVVRQYAPFAEPVRAPFTSVAPAEPSTATTIAYDPLGRVLRTRTPDGRVTSTAYGFAALAGEPAFRFTTTVTDALGRTAVSYRRVDGSVVAIEQHNSIINGVANAAPLFTRYTFDALGQTVRVRDAARNETTAEYDS